MSSPVGGGAPAEQLGSLEVSALSASSLRRGVACAPLSSAFL